VNDEISSVTLCHERLHADQQQRSPQDKYAEIPVSHIDILLKNSRARSPTSGPTHLVYTLGLVACQSYTAHTTGQYSSPQLITGNYRAGHAEMRNGPAWETVNYD